MAVFPSSSLSQIGVFLGGTADYYDRLKKDRDVIETELGQSLVWDGDGGSWRATISQGRGLLWHCRLAATARSYSLSALRSSKPFGIGSALMPSRKGFRASDPGVLHH